MNDVFDTVLDFTPAQPNPQFPHKHSHQPQLILPVLTQAFTPVVTMQDVTQAQPKAP